MSKALQVTLILILLSAVAAAITGEMIYTRLLYLWVLLILVNWSWTQLSLRGITFERKPHARRAQVGHIFKEEVRIRNNSRLPVFWLEVEDLGNLTGSRISRVITRLRAKNARSFLSRTRLLKRGVFEIGPVVITSGDLFGMFTKEKEYKAVGSLLVYPTMVDILRFPHPSGLLPGGESLRRRTHQITPNAAGVREYEPGDSLSRIHWVSTARRDQLMVKEFELDPQADVWVFVDAYHAVHSSLPYDYPDQNDDLLWKQIAPVTLPPSTDEYMIAIAASIARYFLSRSQAVGLVSCSTQMEVIPPDRGARQLGKILELLALLQSNGEMPFPALVPSQAKHLPRGSTVVLVTPDASPEVAVSVDHLVHLGLRPVVVLLDGESFGSDVDSSQLEHQLRQLSVPFTTTRVGDPLESVLSSIVFDHSTAQTAVYSPEYSRVSQ